MQNRTQEVTVQVLPLHQWDHRGLCHEVAVMGNPLERYPALDVPHPPTAAVASTRAAAVTEVS